MQDRYRKNWSFQTFSLLAAGLLGLTLWVPASSASAEEASARSSSDSKRVVARSSARSAQRSAARSSTRPSQSRTRATATRSRSSSSQRPSNSSASPRRVERSDNYHRGRSSSRHRGSSHYRGSYGRYGHNYYGYGHRNYGHSFYYSPYARFSYYPSYSHYGYYPFPYLTWARVGAYSRRSSGDAYGALDFDVSPEKAKIFIDGQQVGVADNFDGFPSYLWLEEGTYDVVIFKEGYETIARQYTVYPGVVIDIEDEMTSGEAVMPEDLISK